MKPFWKSKTFWLNALTLGMAATSGQLPGVDLAIPPGVALVANAGLNLALRFVTRDAISVTPQT